MELQTLCNEKTWTSKTSFLHKNALKKLVCIGYIFPLLSKYNLSTLWKCKERDDNVIPHFEYIYEYSEWVSKVVVRASTIYTTILTS